VSQRISKGCMTVTLDILWYHVIWRYTATYCDSLGMSLNGVGCDSVNLPGRVAQARPGSEICGSNGGHSGSSSESGFAGGAQADRIIAPLWPSRPVWWDENGVACVCLSNLVKESKPKERLERGTACSPNFLYRSYLFICAIGQELGRPPLQLP